MIWPFVTLCICVSPRSTPFTAPASPLPLPPPPPLSHLRFLARAPQTLSCSFLIQQYVVLAAGCPILPIYTYARHTFWLPRWKARGVAQKSSESTLRKIQGNRERFHLYEKFHNIYISRGVTRIDIFREIPPPLEDFYCHLVTVLRGRRVVF